MTEAEEKIRELEQRIAELENHKHSSQPGRKFVGVTLAVLLGIILLMIVVGVIQFISSG